MISYYNSDELELHYATAMSAANFKIGLSNTDQRLHDFIIDLNVEDIDIFEKEISMYLKVLKKI